MKGKLYGVGVGPGDPELITIKAKRILEEVDFIAIPKASENSESLALSIVKGVIDIGKEVIELVFPMSFDTKLLEEGWEKAVEEVKEKLDGGSDVAFITLGDPTVYSTYMYIHKSLKSQGYHGEIIPGITSFCASAAKAGISLGENRETIAVVPSAYDCENLDSILDNFDSVVLMKVSKNLSAIKKKLKERNLDKKAVIVTKCGMKDEKVECDFDKIQEDKLSYFSTVIVKRSGIEEI